MGRGGGRELYLSRPPAPLFHRVMITPGPKERARVCTHVNWGYSPLSPTCGPYRGCLTDATALVIRGGQWPSTQSAVEEKNNKKRYQNVCPRNSHTHTSRHYAPHPNRPHTHTHTLSGYSPFSCAIQGAWRILQRKEVTTGDVFAGLRRRTRHSARSRSCLLL